MCSTSPPALYCVVLWGSDCGNSEQWGKTGWKPQFYCSTTQWSWNWSFLEPSRTQWLNRWGVFFFFFFFWSWRPFPSTVRRGLQEVQFSSWPFFVVVFMSFYNPEPEQKDILKCSKELRGIMRDRRNNSDVSQTTATYWGLTNEQGLFKSHSAE